MFEQYELPYAYDALEPHIDALTVETHYGKHHAAYTANFNAAVEKAGLTGKTAEEILSSLDRIKDPALVNALRNNGGGYYNHDLYFEILSPDPVKAPEGKLADAINATFGSTEALIEKLSALAASQFGSGWAWLYVDKDGKLAVTNSSNQDDPITMGLGKPILALDVWEHAYYLKYRNLRASYIKEFFEVLDWSAVGRKYEAIVG
ncbi:MAG: superoxide dismutase [Oscillospiraceae bacterium]|nr:superoxide dismutase [Oscillospiraceae bacterium]